MKYPRYSYDFYTEIFITKFNTPVGSYIYRTNKSFYIAKSGGLNEKKIEF